MPLAKAAGFLVKQLRYLTINILFICIFPSNSSRYNSVKEQCDFQSEDVEYFQYRPPVE
jgi:hypothetical protein